jgi:hypothetical protein
MRPKPLMKTFVVMIFSFTIREGDHPVKAA